MSGGLYVWRTARKRHYCSGRNYGYCTRVIEPGSRYVRSSLPPGVEPNYGTQWWSHDLCGSCASFYVDVPADPALVGTPTNG